MRCLHPRTVGFQADGKTISWSQKSYSKEFATFQLPCGKCLDCRLEYGRQWAIRCVHEAQMHPENCFITLTYDDEHLLSSKLDYRDFQLFMKKLRKAYPNREIGMFVTGEYGDKQKRPHWHACIFNWAPSDGAYKYSNERGDKSYQSDALDRLWGKGIAEFGSLTFESAGYCARYAAKKLVHGHDGTHQFEPISKKSSKHAIGKKWLEAYWPDVFTHGYVVLPDGNTCAIPRYYEKWLQKNHPEVWHNYVTRTKQEKMASAQRRSLLETEAYTKNADSRSGLKGPGITRLQSRAAILKQKFKLLQEKLKL